MKEKTSKSFQPFCWQDFSGHSGHYAGLLKTSKIIHQLADDAVLYRNVGVNCKYPNLEKEKGR